MLGRLGGRMASPDVNRALRGFPPSLYGISDWKLAAGRGEPIAVVVFPTIRRTGDFQRRKCPVTLDLITDLRLSIAIKGNRLHRRL